MRRGFSIHFSILLLAAAIFPSPSSAAAGGTCSSVRLDQGGRSMSHVPVRSQDGNLGICYSFVAAQMVDAYRFSHEPPEGDRDYSRLTSPLASAAETKVANARQPSINGGDSVDVLEHIKRYGACDARLIEHKFGRNDLSSVLQTLQPYLEGPTYSEIVNQFNEETRRSQASKTNVKGMSSQAIVSEAISGLDPNTKAYLSKQAANSKMTPYQVQKMADTLAKQDPAFLANAASCGAPAESAPGALEIQTLYTVVNELLSKDDRLRELSRAMTLACGTETRHPFHYRTILLKNYPTMALQGIINQKLNGPEPIQPIKIGYCQNVLFRGRGYYGLTNLGFMTVARKDCQMHASLIIGRRSHNGKCQYLVRNSWGTSCCPYSRQWDCQNGNIWVDADSLLDNVENVSYLE